MLQHECDKICCGTRGKYLCCQKGRERLLQFVRYAFIFLLLAIHLLPIFITEIQKCTKIWKKLRVVFFQLLIQFTGNVSNEVLMGTVYTNSFSVWGILHSRIMWQCHRGNKILLESLLFICVFLITRTEIISRF